MNSEKTGDKLMSTFTCALCNLGFINPKETYNNFIEDSVPLKKECIDCNIYYKQSANTTAQEKYIQKKE